MFVYCGHHTMLSQGFSHGKTAYRVHIGGNHRYA
ncbi:Uncharacterised protein [Vibrio cholerae]|nr:Uncharacterised protein [Vibrio cholerae]CSC56236.1 Uncharacterised protein [Vibrio cholerae]CSI75662.1 Uncharacterised protein [Vibrio cholerae]